MNEEANDREKLKDTFAKYGNYGIRFIINSLITATFPTYCFIIYLYEYRIFSYDIFSEGRFGSMVFFYTGLVGIFAINALIALPILGYYDAKNCREAGKQYKLQFIGSAFLSGVVAFLLVLMAIYDFKLMVGAFVVSLSFAGITLAAIKCSSLVLYLLLCGAITTMLYLLTFIGSNHTAHILGKALHCFGSGGGTGVTIVDKDASREGRLILLSPNFIYFTETDSHAERKNIAILPRHQDTEIKYRHAIPPEKHQSLEKSEKENSSKDDESASSIPAEE